MTTPLRLVDLSYREQLANYLRLRYAELSAESREVDGGSQRGGKTETADCRKVGVCQDDFAHGHPGHARHPHTRSHLDAEPMMTRWCRQGTPHPRRRVLLGNESHGNADADGSGAVSLARNLVYGCVGITHSEDLAVESSRVELDLRKVVAGQYWRESTHSSSVRYPQPIKD